jgi:hypothetical protein
MTKPYSTAELSAFLDEALPQDRMASIEQALRGDEKLVESLATVIGQRDAGIHSLGEIWRRHRLSCPSREQLGSYLLEILEPTHASYIRFHVERIGCRYCQANLDDLRRRQSAQHDQTAQTRRKKYFESSAGYLSKDRD